MFVAKTKPSVTEIRNVITSERKQFINNISGEDYSLSMMFNKYRSPVVPKEKDSSLGLCVIMGEGKEECQDEALVLKLKKRYLLGVFDGHGDDGQGAAQACVYHMERMSHKNFVSKPENAVRGLIDYLHEKVCKTKEFDADYSGTTATVALVEPDALHVSWVGDSRALLIVTGKEDFSNVFVFGLTQDHNLSTEEEINRITSSGGIIEDDGPIRRVVDPKSLQRLPGLSMSKSIGDLGSKTLGCNKEADYVKINFSQLETMQDLQDQLPFNLVGITDEYREVTIEHAFYVAASDGVWNIMSTEEVGNFLGPRLRFHKTHNLSQDLCKEAKKRWADAGYADCDDVSAISAFLF